MERFAVVPTFRREASLWRLLDSLDIPQSRVLVLNTGEPLERRPRHCVDLGPVSKRNISMWWNLGLRWASLNAEGRDHATLVVNDDVEARDPVGALLADALDLSGADVAYPSQGGTGHLPWVKRTGCELDVTSLGRDPGSETIRVPFTPEKEHRLTGWCFMVRGGRGLFLDPQFQWWYGDNDLEWRAQQGRGTVEVGGIDVVHHHAGEQTLNTPALQRRARLDRQAFVKKWGRQPW